MLLYYITERTQFPGDEPARREHLLAKIAEAARAGVDYIQLRERDLISRALEGLAGDALRVIRDIPASSGKPRPRLLINSRTDVALAVGADGVHLRSGDVGADVVRQVWTLCGPDPHVRPTIAVSCHSPVEVRQAQAGGADFAVFAPVFEKKDAPGARPTGLEGLRVAARARIPVLALGGIARENVASCLHAGAAGVAAVRLFQENDIVRLVRELRGT